MRLSCYYRSWQGWSASVLLLFRSTTNRRLIRKTRQKAILKAHFICVPCVAFLLALALTVPDHRISHTLAVVAGRGRAQELPHRLGPVSSRCEEHSYAAGEEVEGGFRGKRGCPAARLR